MSDWTENVEAAHAMVSALCKPRGSTGSREWSMSIPARPDHDPDLVITAGLTAAEKRIKELEFQLAACAASPWRFDVEKAPKDGSYLNGYFETEDPLVDGGVFPLTLPCWWDSMAELWDTPEGYYGEDALRAFAIPNPPQVTP